MNIYRVKVDVDKSRSIYNTAPDEWFVGEIVYRPLTKKFGSDWRIPNFAEADSDDEGYNPDSNRCDFVSVNGEIGLRKNAMSGVGDVLQRYGELLPIKVKGEADSAFWFHCTNVLEALDEVSSKIRRFDDGRIMMVDEYAFHADRIANNEIFYVQGTRLGPFCTESLKQKIEAQNLTGLEFTLLWSDEPAGIAYINEHRLRNMNGPSVSLN
jgi:hypothetical protein